MPGIDTNPVNLRSKRSTPMALLSSGMLDATSITPATLKVGLPGASAKEPAARCEDVNGDGCIDQIVPVRTQELGLAAGATQLGLTGELNNGRAISSCDSVSIR